MLVKQPIIQNGVNRASRLVVCIDLIGIDTAGCERKIGSGTGFIHRSANRDFLVTNWHVVTGRNPDSPGELLAGYPDSPSAFRLHLPTIDDQNHFRPSVTFPLYTNGRPNWLETSFNHTSKRIDLVALPFDFGDGPLVVRIDEFSPQHDQRLRVGREIVIIGYPFGIRPENPYPIWKRGYVASEPSILDGELPKYLVDTPGRPGMSGSPVFMIAQGRQVSKKTYDLLNSAGRDVSALDLIKQIDPKELVEAPDVHSLQFAGVYSGVVGSSQLQNMNLGIVWHATVVDHLFLHPRDGENPFPPLTQS
jgi:hypothetical protein